MSQVAWGWTPENKYLIAVLTSARWIDPFTGDLADFIPERILDIIPTRYAPIVLRTISGTVYLEMMDSFWISRSFSFPSRASYEPILEYTSLTERSLPVDIVRIIEETIRLRNSWISIVQALEQKVTVYINYSEIEGSNPYVYLGSDNNYYRASDGSLVTNSRIEFVGYLSLKLEQSVYFLEDSTDKLVQVDPFGTLTLLIPNFSSGLIQNIELLSFPSSLIPINFQLIVSSSPRNYIFEHRIELLQQAGVELGEYVDFYGIPKWYFEYGDKSIPFRVNSNGTYSDVNGNPYSLQGYVQINPYTLRASKELDIRELLLGNHDYTSLLIYQLDNNQTVAIGSWPNSDMDIEQLDRIETGPSNGSDVIVKVYPLIVTDDRLLREIQRRIQNGETDENISIPTDIFLINQKVLEKFITRLYGMDREEIDPVMLGGYTQIDYSELKRLFSKFQVQSFGVSVLLQPFAGPIGTPNQIITLTTHTGDKLYARARYVSGDFLPPI